MSQGVRERKGLGDESRDHSKQKLQMSEWEEGEVNSPLSFHKMCEL